MSREIKFRAWDPTNKRIYKSWDDGSLIGFAFQELIGIRYDEAESLREDAKFFTFMQYTGLKDKNGVEIYEGDILEYRDSDYSFHAAVEWGDNGYVMTGHWLGGGEDNFSFDDNDAEELEVIGNIYDNPDLLKATA